MSCLTFTNQLVPARVVGSLKLADAQMDLSPEQQTEAWAIVIHVMTGQPMPDRGKKEFCAAIAKESPKKRAARLEEAFSEMRWLPPERCAQIDALLAGAGLPSMEALAGSFDEDQAAMVPAVLKRGRIESERERDAVMSDLNDMTSDLTDDQRVELGEMLNDFYRRNPEPLDE